MLLLSLLLLLRLPAVIVCTLAAVSSMVTGVLVGILGLAEALPQTAGAAMTRLLSWACILLGVTGEGVRVGCMGLVCVWACIVWVCGHWTVGV